MRYQVPQFIEVEDKIFGPLTFKQFIYLLGAAGFSFVVFRMLPLFLAFIIAAPIIGLGLALAFYKINNKPFIFTLEAAFRYVTGGKLYIWRKDSRDKVRKEKVEVKEEKVRVPKLSSSKLGELAWGLDINESVENQNGQ